MNAYGVSLPDSGTLITTRAVVVSLAVGTRVTVLSVLAPALGAGQVEPVEAMRSSQAAPPQPPRWRTIVGADPGDRWRRGNRVRDVLGRRLNGPARGTGGCGGADGDNGSVSGRAGAGPAYGATPRPAIGAPFGAVGKLASTNTRRDPRRTATTAIALMLGIALVTVIGMLGATMKRSVDDVAAAEVSADFVLTGAQNAAFSLPGDLPERLRDIDGDGETVSYTQVPVTVDCEFGYRLGPVGVTDVARGDPADLLALDVVEGSSSLDGFTVIAPAAIARERGWDVG